MPMQNYRMVLRGWAFTEAEFVAEDEDEAIRQAEAWARGKATLEELNGVDFDGESWTVDTTDVSDDQGMVTDGGIGPVSDADPTPPQGA